MSSLPELRLTRCCLLLVLAALIVAAKGKEEKAAEEPETWYASTVSQPAGDIVTVHYWSKGPLFRAETVIGGHRIVSIVNGEYYFTIDEVAGLGVAIKRSEKAVAQDATRGRPFGDDVRRLLEDGGEKVGEEKLGKRDFDVYRVTNRQGKTTVWASAHPPRVPVRVQTYLRQTGKEGMLDYTGWQYGLPISDLMFVPNPNVRLMRFEYDEYVKKSARELVGPVPVLYSDLLHGED